MTRREAERFTAIVEEAVRPGGDLPPVRETDAVAAFDAWLRAAPRLNALAMRAALRLGGRVPQLDDVVRRLAAHCYYGDAGVLRRLGYDSEAVIARATAVRVAEGRP